MHRTFEIAGKTYHHIFSDSQTGYPVSSDLASLTIISSLSVDEIWTTRLFGSSLERIFQEVSSQAKLEAIIVDKDNHCFQDSWHIQNANFLKIVKRLCQVDQLLIKLK